MTTSDNTRTILEVQAKARAALTLKWSDGTHISLDLSGTLRGRRFRALREAKQFARARVGEWGHSVEWPCGIDLGADMLWLETLTAIGRDDTRQFLEWRLRHGLSLTKAADALGLSRRMVAYYSNGEKPVPKPILLACKGWEALQAA